MRLIGYTRVSTEEQAGGQSLDAQRERVTAYCVAYGHELVDVVDDPMVSGKTLDRPGVQRVLAALRAGTADGVIVARLDRLTRSARDLWQLIDEHFSERHEGRGRPVAPASALVSVSEQVDTTTPTGRLVLGMFGLVAQWERESIADRTRATLQSMRRRGIRAGGIPFGCALAPDGRTLVDDPGEQSTAGRARELRAGGASLRSVAATLAGEGRVNRRGAPFNAASIRAMLAAPCRAVTGPDGAE